jgi:hypothetical protein
MQDLAKKHSVVLRLNEVFVRPTRLAYVARADPAWILGSTDAKLDK